MAESVSFKVHVTEIETKDQVDVGKFIVDKDVAMNFNHLQEKVTSVFPSLQNKTFTVNWTDEDGDIVTIASDDELAIALNEMKGPVYDIQIRVKGGEKKDDPNESKTISKVHPNVTCDGCEKSILGFRYKCPKCLVCDDYDLCGSCEGTGVHPGHNMLRIASPEGNFPQHFFKRLHRMQEKVERRRRCRQEREENQVMEEEGLSDKLLHGKRFGGVGCGRPGHGRFRALRARSGLYGGPHLGPFGVLDHGPRGRPHVGLHGRPHARHHGGPHARPHGGLHGRLYGGLQGRLHGGPHCRPLGGPHGRLHVSPLGGQHCRPHGGPGGKTHGGPGGRPHGGPHCRPHGGPGCRPHGGPGGRPHGGWHSRLHDGLHGNPSDGPHDHHQDGLHWRPHSANHVGPFQIHHFAMRMARQNPDFYAAFLQATLSNSLTPHKLKIQPRRRLVNLRKGRILTGQTKGWNNTSDISPLHGGSITKEPDSTPKAQDDSAGHHQEEIVDC